MQPFRWNIIRHGVRLAARQMELNGVHQRTLPRQSFIPRRHVGTNASSARAVFVNIPVSLPTLRHISRTLLSLDIEAGLGVDYGVKKSGEVDIEQSKLILEEERAQYLHIRRNAGTRVSKSSVVYGRLRQLPPSDILNLSPDIRSITLPLLRQYSSHEEADEVGKKRLRQRILSQVAKARRTLTKRAEYRRWDTSEDRVDHLEVFDYKRVYALSRERSTSTPATELRTLPYALTMDEMCPPPVEDRNLATVHALVKLDEMLGYVLPGAPMCAGMQGTVEGDESGDEDEGDGDDEEGGDEDEEEDEEEEFLNMDYPEEVELEDEETDDEESGGEE